MEAESVLSELARRVAAAPEAPMRRERVCEALLRGSAPEAFVWLRALLHGPPDPGGSLEALRRIVLDALFRGGAAGPLDYGRRAELYAEAAARGDEPLQRLLRTPVAAETMADPAAALHRDLAELPLGTRRARATGLDRSVLEKLLLDPDPLVVRHLLENPRVVEADVVRVAARRPVPRATLEVIARSERFGRRLRVQSALARNPYAPTDVAIHALPALPRRELREIARDPHLHPDTRAHASFELERRAGGESDG